MLIKFDIERKKEEKREQQDMVEMGINAEKPTKKHPNFSIDNLTYLC